MKIQEMFKSDINRNINGVIKVFQNDEESMEQELREYIVTRELRSHFATFYANYEKAFDVPTDKIGVWISGFFGSGKSHFLKILSYLLENKIVAGKYSAEYFSDKFDDPMMYSTVKRCSKVQTEAILFDIDIKGSIKKDNTAILRVFAKVFYEHLGLYGDDFKLTKLEQIIRRRGKMDEFKSQFKAINGDTWEKTRPGYAIFEDHIVEALVKVFGIGEAGARNWFKGEDDAELSIEQLTDDIKEYVDSKEKDFRLLFMIDEVGFYIGAESSLMLNLQTIVESLGTKCKGNVWVMVTSQEAIDSITKITGDDFSKIQGRFNTRISLSSSSVDEVIKKRVLAKDDNAKNLLNLVYNKNSAVLKNLFTFNNPIVDIKGYANEIDFAETYPFVPYQFILLQNVFAQIRKHGNAGKHLAGGERSMLSGFQEAAQAIKEKDEYALAPFYLFYNTVFTFLEGTIRRVIDRCTTAAENGDGLEKPDVDVLKLLYLIRYVDDNIKANIDNIAILMLDDMRADKIAIRSRLSDSLERLLSQNYIARNGDTYSFLTDDEQDISREINNTAVDSAMIVQSISQTIFGDIFSNKKFRYGIYDFSLDQLVDDTVFGVLTGSIKLRIVTVASDLYKSSEQELIMKSRIDNETIVILSDEFPYFNEIESAMKIRKYVKQRNVSQMPESIQNIIRNRQQQATVYETRAKGFIEQSLMKAKFYSAGQNVIAKGGSIKDRLDFALSYLVESVFSKLSCVRKNFDSDADIMLALKGGSGQLSWLESNDDAAKEIMQFLELQKIKHLPTSMGDIQRKYSAIPYGWREIDVAGIAAGLCAAQKITVQYAGSSIQPTDSKMPDYLRRRSEIDKTVISLRVDISSALLQDAREFLRDYLNKMDVPADEDNLFVFIVDNLSEKKAQFRILLENEYEYRNYPGKEALKNGIELLDNILSQKKDNAALLARLLDRKGDLNSLDKNMDAVKNFFSSQRVVFDGARELLEKCRIDMEYLRNSPDVIAALKNIEQILTMQEPYGRIMELPALMQDIQNGCKDLIDEKKKEVLSVIQQAMGDVHSAMVGDPRLAGMGNGMDDFAADKKKECENAVSIVALDAMITRIVYYRDNEVGKIENKVAELNKEYGLNIKTVHRNQIYAVRELKSADDVDSYVEAVRGELKELLADCDGIQIS